MKDLIIGVVLLAAVVAAVRWLIRTDDEEVCEVCSQFNKRKDMEVVGGDVFYTSYACKSCLKPSSKKD